MGELIDLKKEMREFKYLYGQRVASGSSLKYLGVLDTEFQDTGIMVAGYKESFPFVIIISFNLSVSQ